MAEITTVEYQSGREFYRNNFASKDQKGFKNGLLVARRRNVHGQMPSADKVSGVIIFIAFERARLPGSRDANC